MQYSAPASVASLKIFLVVDNRDDDKRFVQVFAEVERLCTAHT